MLKKYLPDWIRCGLILGLMGFNFLFVVAYLSVKDFAIQIINHIRQKRIERKEQIMATDVTFTLEYFNSEVCNFRKLMGNRDFMSDQKKKDAALHALTFCYFNVETKNDEEQTSLINTFTSTMIEFDKRIELLVGLSNMA